MAAIQAKKFKNTAKVPAKKAITGNQEPESDSSSDEKDLIINDTSDDELDDFMMTFAKRTSNREYVLVRYEKKTLLVHYVGVAIADISEEVEVRFFKRQPSKHDEHFYLPRYR